MKSQTKLIIGAAAVAALGAVVAGLFATDEGRKTRKKLAKKARKMRNKTLQQVGEAKVSARRQYENVKQTANNIVDQGKGLVSGITGGNSGSAGSVK